MTQSDNTIVEMKIRSIVQLSVKNLKVLKFEKETKNSVQKLTHKFATFINISVKSKIIKMLQTRKMTWEKNMNPTKNNLSKNYQAWGWNSSIVVSALICTCLS